MRSLSTRGLQKKLWMGLGVAALLVMPSMASADDTAPAVPSITIPAKPLVSFDISWVDPNLHLYFLADRTNQTVEVIRTDTASFFGFISPQGSHAFAGAPANCPIDCAGPNGVLTLSNSGPTTLSTAELWVGDGDSTVKIFTAQSVQADGGATPAFTISTGGKKRADELCFDPDDHLVMIANDADSPPFVTFIDSVSKKVLAQLPFGEATNGIEQCQYSKSLGKFLLNLPEWNGPGDDTGNGALYVIDPKAMAVADIIWIPATVCAGPQGLALAEDLPNGQKNLLLGCNAQSVVNGQPVGTRNAAIIDTTNGLDEEHLNIATLTGAGGSDEVWYNPGDQQYYLSGGSALDIEHASVVDAATAEVDIIAGIADNSGHTGRRAHSRAVDPTTNDVYIPMPANTAGFSSPLCFDPSRGCVFVGHVTETQPEMASQ